MAKITGRVGAPTTIDLYGLKGSFSLPGSTIKIHFLSTSAAPTGDAGHVALLQELKPMRERVNAAEIKDLTSLLQRDLNDKRVSEELVPYLRGENSPIGFFPAVLAVLVPKHFLSNPAMAVYPTAKTNKNVTSYGGNWEFEHYEMDGKILPLGLLRITLTATDVIVLDGQHRASAFRRVAGLFPPAKTIYEAFYSLGEEMPTMTADLPVTLIWFETTAEDAISPNLISRQLFVDVNNNAREVSKARTILLDDRHISAIGTQELYRYAAERSFGASRFSLLHSAFDMGVDLAERAVPAFALTTPEIIDDALRWACFGSTSYDGLHTWSISRMLEPRNKARFLTLFPDMQQFELAADDEETLNPHLRVPAAAKEFRKQFEKEYRPVLSGLLEELSLLGAHYKAAASIDAWIVKDGNSALRTVWSEVFKGGEGLYWVLRRDTNSNEGKDRVATYRSAIDEIEKEFLKRRAKLAGGDVKGVDGCYEAFRSKAFQIGYVMAVDFRASGTGDWLTANSDLVARLDSFTMKNWIAALTELRPLLLGSTGTNPRTWPAHRNLLLRMADEKSREIYDQANWEITPDWQACMTLLKRVAESVLETHETMPEAAELQSLSEAQVKKLVVHLEASGLKPILANKPMIKQATDYLTLSLKPRFNKS